jgi:hypothetical protein
MNDFNFSKSFGETCKHSHIFGAINCCNASLVFNSLKFELLLRELILSKELVNVGSVFKGNNKPETALIRK